MGTRVGASLLGSPRCSNFAVTKNLNTFDKMLFRHHFTSHRCLHRTATSKRKRKLAPITSPSFIFNTTTVKNMSTTSASKINANAASTGLLFVGQGAQTVGMTQNELEIPRVAEMYEIAEKVLGYDLKQIVMNGPAEKLSQTEYAQPALLIAGLAAVEKLRLSDSSALDNCAAVAGLSLGEYTALVHAGALSFEDAIKVVGVRAAAMQAAAEATNGKMVSVVGVTDAPLKGLCLLAENRTGKVVKIANYLFPKGRVVAGHAEAVDAFKIALSESNEKPLKVGDLVVSGAFHTSLMSSAQAAVANVLKEVEVKLPTIPVVANTTGRTYSSVEEIKTELAKQVVEPVLWENGVRSIIDSGCHLLYDMGPRTTIKAMVRKIDMKISKKIVDVQV